MWTLRGFSSLKETYLTQMNWIKLSKPSRTQLVKYFNFFNGIEFLGGRGKRQIHATT